MRIALTVVVVAALLVVGVQAGLRVTDREEVESGRSTPVEVAESWAVATSAADVAALVELAAERTDTELLRSMHTEILPQLDGPQVELQDVRLAGSSNDNRAVATLAWTAQPGDSEGDWNWTSELELIRARGIWSADWDPTALHPDLEPGWALEVAELPPSRAPILDREGRTLSSTGANVEIGVQPGRLPALDRLLPTVASALPEARRPLTALLERDDLVDDWYYPLVTVSAQRAEAAWVDLIGLPGLIRREAAGGVGPAIAAAEIVGTVELGPDGLPRGTSGLEEQLEDRLIGSAATQVRLLTPEGGIRETLFTFQADPAAPLVTTLDRDVQQAVDDAVIAVDDPVGVVVIDPATAGVLAVASRPTNSYPRALEGRYPPGAVAGLVALAAALQDGAALDDAIECPTDAVVGGLRITTRDSALGGATRDSAPGGATLADVLGGGCDVALARLGLGLGDQALLDAVATLGLDTEVQLPVPARGWSWPSTSSEAGLASWSVGHGQVESSALGAAQLAATVARGATAAPIVLAEEVDDDPSVLPPGLLAGLRGAMRTAGADGPVQVSGARIAGFAASSGGVGGDPAPATGWWVGFVEGGGQDAAIAVVVENGDAERAVAIAQRVARELVG